MSEAEETGSLTVDGQAGERLDRAVQEALPHLSRSAVQRLVEAGHVRVNGRPARAGYRLRAGEAVEWEVPEESAPSPLEPEAIPLEVVYEDQQILVLNKPRGLVVHPAPGHRTGTLVHAVLAHTAEEGRGLNGEDVGTAGAPDRPGIVHRLDRDTSGLIVVAKTEPAYQSLQRQIQERTAERRYLALVRGTPRFERASVDAPIGRHAADRKKMAVIPPGSARTHRCAWTDLRVLERFPGFALLEARLETGRTHQVRVHCAYIHLPVVGDETYGAKRVDRDPTVPAEVRAAVRGLRGQALHAYRLSFDHPSTGKRLQFLAPPPGDFREVLAALGSRWEIREEDPWPE